MKEEGPGDDEENEEDEIFHRPNLRAQPGQRE
jgi:hypothetical protein